MPEWMTPKESERTKFVRLTVHPFYRDTKDVKPYHGTLNRLDEAKIEYNFEWERCVLQSEEASLYDDNGTRVTFSPELITATPADSKRSWENSKNMFHGSYGINKSLIDEFEAPMVTPFDLVELQALDEMKELKSVLCKTPDATSLPSASPFPHTKPHQPPPIASDKQEELSSPTTTSPFNKHYSVNDTHSPASLIQPLDIDWGSLSPNNVEYGKSLVSMGFSPLLVTLILRNVLPDRELALDKLIALQGLLNSHISAETVAFFVTKLGADEKTIKCWVSYLLSLKDLGFKEAEAREALVTANGKFDVVLKLLTK